MSTSTREVSLCGVFFRIGNILVFVPVVLRSILLLLQVVLMFVIQLYYYFLLLLIAVFNDCGQNWINYIFNYNNKFFYDYAN